MTDKPTDEMPPATIPPTAIPPTAIPPTAIPLWEVFLRPRTGLSHQHVGSVHASDEVMAVQAARDVYTRRGEGVSIWVVPSASITASDPQEREGNFDPSTSKIYRHPSFYDIPDDVGHM
jgi:ring-1,2-phenylacetyl-CoA epoxidase subunit PaaB